MLDNIKAIVINAEQILLSKKFELEHNSDEYLQVNALYLAYVQLRHFIDAAEKQHATAGLLILSRQLHKNSAELNANDVMKNFLDVLTYQNKTTFSMNQQPHLMSGLNTAKMFAMAPLLFMVPIIAAMLPALFLSPLPLLFLAISALPLLAVYAFDEPFSMSRWYQEMAGIEKTLAWVTLGLAAALVILLPTLLSSIPLLTLGMTYAGMLITGFSLLKHSQHLQAKHEALSSIAPEVNHALWDKKSTLNQFFKPATASGEDGIEVDNALHQTLRGITAGC
jgi:hypothetical protein